MRYIRRLRRILDPDVISEFLPGHDWIHGILGLGPFQEGVVLAFEDCVEFDVLSPLYVFRESVEAYSMPEDVISERDILRAYAYLMCLWRPPVGGEEE